MRVFSLVPIRNVEPLTTSESHFFSFQRRFLSINYFEQYMQEVGGSSALLRTENIIIPKGTNN